MNYRVNTHDAHRTEYQAMGFKIADIEKGGAMTKRNIDRHIENLSPFVKELQRAAFRAGAEAERRETITLIDDVNGDVGTIDFIVARLRARPLPEIPEQKAER